MAVINKVLVGESLVGEGNEVAHVDLIMGPRGSAAETAFCNALTNNKDGFTSLGLSGRAQVVFIQDPKINRVPPPGVLGTARTPSGRRRRGKRRCTGSGRPTWTGSSRSGHQPSA